MQNRAVIYLGHSHTYAVVNYLRDRPAPTEKNGPGVEHYVFDTIRHTLNFPYAIQKDDGRLEINPEVHAAIERHVPPGREIVIACMFGGNAHNALTLFEHPRPFDFILPEDPKRERIAGTELLPSGYVREYLEKLTLPYVQQQIAARNSFNGDVFQLESPPPKGDNEYIRNHLEDYFIEQGVEGKRIAPRELRYKLWRLHTDIIRKACVESNTEFVPAPKESLLDDGFMKPEAYADATHANPWYGGLLVGDIEKRYNAHYAGWAWIY